MSQAWLDRKQACDAYVAEYPDDEWADDIHIIVGDYNFEEHWIYGAIAAIATKLRQDEFSYNATLRRRLFLLVDLLKLPLPEEWDDDDAI